MAKLLEFLDRHTARNLFRSSHLKPILAMSPDSFRNKDNKCFLGFF